MKVQERYAPLNKNEHNLQRNSHSKTMHHPEHTGSVTQTSARLTNVSTSGSLSDMLPTKPLRESCIRLRCGIKPLKRFSGDGTSLPVLLKQIMFQIVLKHILS